MSNLIGQSLGRYTILEQLGGGGMATVYKAYDTRLERDVAVKVLHTEQFAPAVLKRILKRFEREAKALARLSHPNIVKVLDYGEHESAPYLVLEYLPGGALKQRLGKPIPWEEAIRLLLPIADALAYAHEQNILHRDVKPSNILLTENSEPMLTDFGIAKILDLEDGQTLTATGVGVGTPEYMSPEQGLGKPVGPQTDVYSLGVVLYELITGRKPYTADTPMAVVVKHLHASLPRPGQFVPGLPESIEKILLKALAKDPADRYAGMGEFAAALQRVLSPATVPDQPSAVQPPSAVHRPPSDDAATIGQGASGETVVQEEERRLPSAVRRPRSKPWLPLAIVAFLLGLGVVLGGGLIALGTRGLGPLAGLATSTRPPAPTLAAGPTWTRPADGMVMVYVPAGEFTMGSPQGVGDDNEHPEHRVYLDAFWIDRTEVTNAMYARCVQAGVCQPPHNFSSWTRSNYYGNATYADYPVMKVDWYQAQTYCEWAGARLPTEAEWEKAARGTDAYVYPWGNDFDCRKGNFDDETQIDSYFVSGGPNCDGYVDTAPVGSYLSGASPYGALDMAGNVWEWVADWYDGNYYSQSPGRNPQGPASGTFRALRGGSLYYYEYNVRASSRYWFAPDFWNFSLGFRCSRPLP